MLPGDEIQVQIIATKRVLRLISNQTFNGSLGDYTQRCIGVPPLVRLSTRHGLSSRKKEGDNNYSQTTADCPQSTVVSGTTPSGCTWRALTGLDPTRHDLSRPTGRTIKRHLIKSPAESNIRQWSQGQHPVGALCVPPPIQRYTRHDLVDSSGRTI